MSGETLLQKSGIERKTKTGKRLKRPNGRFSFLCVSVVFQQARAGTLLPKLVARVT
ncbi:hypothetical protein GA0061071_10289 [Kosakonia oryzendophytica]|uniref:Uncharacterized protein n=1 Tax=Kosakonia oryzendophytica TaxID=1005665 RepID=A0A1C3ZR10_9ENTR|nr:hypothetical protein DFO53_3789 [Enterobacter sp. AG5470]SCB84808.1 hypothetical protein GA0061071_10289 [Kosakonia oryzendophytica]